MSTYAGPSRTYAGPRNPAAPTTAAQGGFIRSLAARVGETVEVPATMGEASVLIETLQRKVRALPASAPLEVGIYRVEHAIFKVQKSRETGNLYAKRLVIPQRAGLKATFVYAAGAIRTLTVADRLTVEQAKALGHQYGICVVCGAELSDPKSVAAGIGPVCAKRV